MTPSDQTENDCVPGMGHNKRGGHRQPRAALSPISQHYWGQGQVCAYSEMINIAMIFLRQALVKGVKFKESKNVSSFLFPYKMESRRRSGPCYCVCYCV